jgi:hypothetical protein
MLIKTSDRVTLPSKKEALDNLRQSNKDMTAVYKLPNQKQLVDPERHGQYIFFDQIVQMVKKMNPVIWFEPSKLNPGHGGLYWMKGGKPHLLTSFALDFLPEFTLVYEDAKGLPYKADRGWRDVFLMLIKQRAITKEQILHHFANPNESQSEAWLRRMQGVN